MNLKLFEEFDIYNFQYGLAIYRLLDSNPNIMDMIYPLINLIYQKIENEVKMYIAEPHMREKTFKELKIENTHKLNDLLTREELRKYYEDIEICEKYFKSYTESVKYFYEILGDNCFLNSRYPIQKEQNDISLKKKVNREELYKKWAEYSIASGKFISMYMAYGSSNTIIYLKREGKINNEFEENRYIEEIVCDAFCDIKGIDFESEKNDIFLLIKEFVKRDKYFDMDYVC